MNEEPRQSAKINAATAHGTFPAFNFHNLFVMDPEEPHESAEDIYRRTGNKMTDPRLMNHNCPMCRRTMTWDLFTAHAEGCFRKWFHTLDVTKHTFGGANLG